jgi:P-type Ca2+ transporter type 2C
MWKMIIGQSVVQLAIIFALYFDGGNLFPDWTTGTRKTVVFNTFVWLQIFNEINCRRLDNKLNIFSGITSNLFFIIILLFMIVSQIAIIFAGGAVFSVIPLTKEQWLLSTALGFIAIPTGALVRLIPNEFIKMFIPNRFLKRQRTFDDEEREYQNVNHTLGAFQDDPLPGIYRR